MWRQQKNPQGVRIKYTDEEQAVLSLLQENQNLSLSQYARQAKIPKWKLEKILVKLIVVGVVGMEHKDNGTRFYLREDVNVGGIGHK